MSPLTLQNDSPELRQLAATLPLFASTSPHLRLICHLSRCFSSLFNHWQSATLRFQCGRLKSFVTKSFQFILLMHYIIWQHYAIRFVLSNFYDCLSGGSCHPSELNLRPEAELDMIFGAKAQSAGAARDKQLISFYEAPRTARWHCSVATSLCHCGTVCVTVWQHCVAMWRLIIKNSNRLPESPSLSGHKTFLMGIKSI